MTATPPEAADPLDTMNNFATETQTQLHNSITLADQKAGFLFGTVTAILAYLHTSGATGRLLQSIRGQQPWTFSEVVVAIAVIGLVAGAIAALMVVIPRAPRPSKGIVASWAIACFDQPQEYAKEVLQTDPATLARAKLEHCWVLAQIGRRKYRYINVALRCGFVGLVASVAYLVLG